MENADFIWKPTATLETLRQRALILQAVRTFFDNEGYWEVETPLLSRESIVDAYIDPMAVPCPERDPQCFYLQTSPEAHMKRLLSAGADRIFQLTRSFRKGERGNLHNSEFTMLEWYACQQTHHDQMDLVERLVRYLCLTLKDKIESIPKVNTEPFERFTYQAAAEKYPGVPVLELSNSELKALAKERNLAIPESLQEEDRDGWLNLILAELIEPHLGVEHPTFLHDYPASQSALAVIREGDIPVAERFELYIDGIEFCNGYHELGDADELRSRFEKQNEIRLSEQRASSPTPELFLAAMAQGYPASAGVALGLDRLVMWLLNKTRIEEVIPFPDERA